MKIPVRYDVSTQYLCPYLYSSSVICVKLSQANPTTHKVGTISALVLASHQPQIRAIFQEFNFKAMVPDKESEDEFESADEGVSNL